MLQYFSSTAHVMWAYWWSASQVVGVMVLFALTVWLASVVYECLQPLRLLDRLHERVVLITGCDTGFGAALARRLDALGVQVFAGCLFPDGPGARQLVADCSSRLRVLQLDVTSEQQVRDAIATIEDSLEGKGLWAVVNNAGVLEGGEVEMVPLETYERVFAVNTLGVVRVTQACLPLIRRARGRIVTVASVLGRTSMPLLTPYCMSKFAIVCFCQALRIEMKKWGVSVCLVEPTSYMSDLNNPDYFRTTVFKNFQKLPEGIRETYGEDYAEKCAKRLIVLTFFAKPRDKIFEVVDELVDACVGRYSQVERIPAFMGKITYTILPRLPNYVKDFIMYILFQWRMTITKTEKNTRD